MIVLGVRQPNGFPGTATHLPIAIRVQDRVGCSMPGPDGSRLVVSVSGFDGEVSDLANELSHREVQI
jgi:hypothetical protein